MVETHNLILFRSSRNKVGFKFTSVSEVFRGPTS